MLICLTASHRNADFDVLERLAAADATMLPTLLASSDGVDGAVVVSTCNRFEAYLDVSAEQADAAARAALDRALTRAGAPGEVEHVEALYDAHAAEHLFAVAAGLESVVVGEGEIAGQVRRALAGAQDAGTTTSDLERLFQRSIETQRGVKRRTGLGEQGRSIVRLALDLASDRIHDWSQARVLLVGTGRFAAASLAALRDRGVRQVEVWSPSGRGERFARSHGIGAVDGRDAPIALASADVVVTCTTSSEHVIDAAMISAGRRALAATHAYAGQPSGHPHLAAVGAGPFHGPSDAPARVEPAVCPVALQVTGASCPVEHGRSSQLVIDMGLPRNVAPDVSTVHGVELLDLETIRIHAPLEHLTATDDARALVQKAARTYQRVGEEQRLGPAVAALRQHVSEALEAELVRVRRRGTQAEQLAAEQALRHFAGVLLHQPSVRARQLAADGRHADYLDALEALFGIDDVA
ncbi:glutamyl-tRNA reductase [Agrococcus sp. SGAir0287]|uniref:glutamyl-tRNA reductase n=1 Tax=Agrococcus sp. SGAir0287 TaxID=2070347 RepID=UPI0010CD496E|nr:glutamyl-tRNA reductase [Agrococcus sp. SGAir0287]QCR18128.1 glutamyl-tRNA reductase [Agrococcus sp. SGAir0287]